MTTKPLTPEEVNKIEARYQRAVFKDVRHLCADWRRMREALVQRVPGLSRVNGKDWMMCRICRHGWQEGEPETHCQTCDSPRAALHDEGGEKC